MINHLTGDVSFEDGLNLKPRASVENFEAIPGVRKGPAIAGRTQLSLGLHRVADGEWGVGAVFVEGLLTQVLLQYLNAPSVQRNILDVANEELRKQAHDAIVCNLFDEYRTLNTLNSPAALAVQRPWGRVSSILDRRGVQALILIEY